MHEAKTNLSKLVEAIASGTEQEITISRSGVPAAKLVAVGPKPRKKFGFAKGRFAFEDEAFSRLDAEVQWLFKESADPMGDKLKP